MKTCGPAMQCSSKTLYQNSVFILSTYGHQPKLPLIICLINNRLTNA